MAKRMAESPRTREDGRMNARYGWGLFVAIAAACGGKAVIDGGAGGGGSGGAGSGQGGKAAVSSSSGAVVAVGATTVGSTGSGQTGQTGQTSGGQTSTTGSGGASPCGSACMAVAQCAGVADCMNGCQNVKPSCLAAHDAWLECLLKNQFGSPCAHVAACDGQLAKYTSCDDYMGGAGSSDPNGGCSGKFAIGGHTMTVQCTPGNAVSFCTCGVEGNPIGKCTGPLDKPCSLNIGCCAPLWLINH